MNADLERLIELEKVDHEATRLSEEVAALPKRVALIEEKLAQHKTAVEKAKASIKDNEAARRRHEADVQSFQQKIIKYREQSTKVKTNEEYRALMHEVSFAEKEISGCEDKVLELMLGLEAQEKALKVAEAELKTEGAEVEKEKDQARARTAEDERLLADLKAKRDQLRSQVNDSALAHYDRVIRQRKSAVAEARGQKCMSCFVMLRPQVWQEIRNNDQIVTCSSCGRILFFDPAHEAPAPEIPVARKKSKHHAASADADQPESEVVPSETPAQ